MALMDRRGTLKLINPIVTSGICFMCQTITEDESIPCDDDPFDQVEINRSLKKYVNIQVAEGSLCKQCLQKLQLVVTSVDELRNGVLVDKVDTYSSSHFAKVSSSDIIMLILFRIVSTFSDCHRPL